MVVLRLYLFFVLSLKINCKLFLSTICFWDIRPQKALTPQPQAEKKKEESIEIPFDIPSTFLHLDLSWKPLSKVSNMGFSPFYLLIYTI